MLRRRAGVAAIFIPIMLAGIWLGGWVYTIGVALILAMAALEYVQLLKKCGVIPASLLVVGGTLVLVVARKLDGFNSAPALLSLLVLLSMTWHLVAYERGRNECGSDFGVSLGGIFYLGWIGAYFISLRMLPDGKWWLLLVLPVIWLADSGAFLIGVRFGRHKLSPRLSPKKSWEGYIAGIVTGTLTGAALALLWSLAPEAWGPPAAAGWPNAWQGALIGFVLSALTILGDLGESMFKRQVGVKDSGKILPGHGGAFDRIDSWLWGVVIGYYLALLL